jgi:hypothetical protein
MTRVDKYGFYFEKAGLAGYQGPNDPSEEHFTGKDIEQSLTREMIQNSLDAKADGTGPVLVIFELSEVNTDAIPGIFELRDAMAAAVESSGDLQGHEHVVDAYESACSSRVPVLRIRDYGTLGLTGSESRDYPHTALSMLTRGTGASSNDPSRGGSFGIGSSVGPLASKMRTVAYASKRQEDEDVIFASVSRLSSHRDGDGMWRLGTGYYTYLEDLSDFRYRRNPATIDGFDARTEAGTDVYVYDYRAAGRTGLLDVKRAAAENFMVAIHRGRLVVEGRTPTARWRLDSDTLQETIEGDEVLRRELLPFYRALTETKAILGNLRHTGEVKLYIHVDDTLEKKLGTQVMRKLLMRVTTLQHTFHVPYAAVFICENDQGNQTLRAIEPPTHDKWNDKGPRSNEAAVKEIKTFIRKELLEVVPQKLGKTTTIRGLARFLPLDLGQSGDDDTGTGTSPSDRAGSETESPRRLGRPEKPSALDWQVQGRYSVPVSRQGTADHQADTIGRRGSKSGAKASADEERKDKETPAAEGNGRVRIPSSHIGFRSFAEPEDGYATIVLKPLQDAEGDLELTALGSAGSDVYEAPISSVQRRTPDGLIDLEVHGATVLNLKLSEGERVSLRVKFRHGGRYRLGVKNG